MSIFSKTVPNYKFELGQLVKHKTNFELVFVVEARGYGAYIYPSYCLSRVSRTGKYQRLTNIGECEIELAEERTQK
jgi:hypothetical protein